MFSLLLLVVAKSPSQERKTITATAIKDTASKDAFQISRVTAIRPDDLVIPSLGQNVENRCGIKRETVRTIRLKFIPCSEKRQVEISDRKTVDMEPVGRLPRSSELIRLERQKSVSRENVSSSTDSLNEGSQKKARLKIPKPSKLLSIKSRTEDKDKKKKEDSNNNCK